MNSGDLGALAVPIDPQTGSGFDAVVRAVADAQVVLLGEATHGDGASFALRAALVSHLHRVGAVDALAWEAGSYDCWRMDRNFRLGLDAATALRSGVHGIWVAEEVLPLAEYTCATYDSDRPLQHLGFDTQFSSITSVDTIAGDLRVLLTEAGVSFDDGDLDAVTRLARHSLPLFEPLSDEGHRLDRARLDRLAERCRAAAPEALCTRFVADVAANDDVQPALNSWVRGHRATDPAWQFDETDPFYKSRFVRRDQAMAGNLLSLAAEEPRRTIAGWLANGHALRNVRSINSGTDARFTDFATMGGLVHEALGAAVYTILTTSHHGLMNTGTATPPQSLPSAPAGSIEAELHDLGHTFAFLDLRTLPADSEWRLPTWWRAWGPEPAYASLADLADGLLYIDEQMPSTLITVAEQSV